MTNEQTTSEAGAVEVVDNPAARRFEARVDGRVVATTEYRLSGPRIVFLHTETDEAMEGRGIGSRLVKGALDDARARGLRVVARCPFVSAWLKRHQDYADLIDRPSGSRPSGSRPSAG